MSLPSTMWEPIDPAPAMPKDGWPRALIRLELDPDADPALVFYELACASRRLMMGVVTHYGGVELFVYPHQDTGQIARTFLRIRNGELKAAVP